MVTHRDSTQAKEELCIFKSFLNAYPSLGKEIVDISQPCRFPDIRAKLRNGSAVDFELGEWLDGEQMQRAKGTERLESDLLRALGEQGINESRYFRCVMLILKESRPRFQFRDSEAFRSELLSLIAEHDRRWPSKPHWDSRQGHVCREFASYPTVAKYLSRVKFDPFRLGTKMAEPWRTCHDWIFFPSRGGFYSPDTAWKALLDRIREKASHYDAHDARGVRLLVHYNQAVLYNTPFYGIETREFEDVVAKAAQALAGKSLIFAKIYLLQALEPDLQAFEIYPELWKCQ